MRNTFLLYYAVNGGIYSFRKSFPFWKSASKCQEIMVSIVQEVGQCSKINVMEFKKV